jgi:hypothetical protein
VAAAVDAESKKSGNHIKTRTEIEMSGVDRKHNINGLAAANDIASLVNKLDDLPKIS